MIRLIDRLNDWLMRAPIWLGALVLGALVLALFYGPELLLEVLGR